MYNKSKKLVRIACVVVVLCVAAYGVYLLYTWATTPTSSSITVVQQRSDQENNTEKDQQIRTSYYETLLPGSYTLQIATKKDPPYLVQASAINYRETINEIGIVSGALPQGGIDEVSDYKLRQSNSETYIVENGEYDFTQGQLLAFRKNDQTELSIFVISPNSTYASITLTSQSPSEEKLGKIAQEILKSWRWL